MALSINGTTGISGVDGSASTPALKGTDSNTGINFGTDTVNINTGGTTRATVDSSGALDVPTDFPIKVNGSEKLRIDSSGHVGLGTSNPSAALEVIESSSSRSYSLSGATELVVERAGDVNLSLITTNTHNSRIRFGDTDDEDAGAIDYDHNNNNLSFRTAADFRCKIDSVGRLVMGSPTVNTTVANSLVTTGRIQSDATASLTTGSAANVFISSATGLMQRGNVSSLRYKKDITDATWGLADVLKLKAKTFKSKATGENGETDDTTYAGFIAEDVHDIGLTNFVEYDDKNQPDAIHYANMVALLTKAIQELNTKVTTLETKVAALEAA